MNRQQRRAAYAKVKSALGRPDIFGADNEEIAREADRHAEVLDDLSDDELGAYAEAVIRSHDVVLGTFVDPSLPCGIGVVLIKGREATAIIRATRSPGDFKVTAIPCQTHELAVDAMMLWGDGAQVVRQ